MNYHRALPARVLYWDDTGFWVECITGGHSFIHSTRLALQATLIFQGVMYNQFTTTIFSINNLTHGTSLENRATLLLYLTKPLVIEGYRLNHFGGTKQTVCTISNFSISLAPQQCYNGEQGG